MKCCLHYIMLVTEDILCAMQALGLEAIKTHHWQIQACSAVTGERLLDGINWMTTDISSRIFTMD